MAGETTTAADGKHPSRMHSCCCSSPTFLWIRIELKLNEQWMILIKYEQQNSDKDHLQCSQGFDKCSFSYSSFHSI